MAVTRRPNAGGRTHSDSDGEDDDGLLQQMAAEAEGPVPDATQKPTPDESKVFDESVLKWKNSPECKEANRISRLADQLDTLVIRLDRYLSIDDAWSFWSAPDADVPARRPPPAARWAAARNNFFEMLADIHATTTAAGAVAFRDSRDIQVCLNALRDDLFLEHHDELLWLGDTAGRPREAINTVKRIFKTARWTFRQKLILLSASTKLTADEIRKDASPKFFSAHVVTDVPNERPPTRDPSIRAAKQKILQYWHDNPDSKLKPPQLARILRIRNQTVYRALKQLDQLDQAEAGTAAPSSHCSRNNGTD